MDLQDQPTRHAGLLQVVVEADQCHLEDVGRQTLDAGVHRLPLAGLSDVEVGRRELGDPATTAEQRLRVTAVAGLGHRPVHVVAHGRKGGEVAVEDVGRLVDRDPQPLREAVRLHAVRQAVGDHLRPGAQLRGHVSRIDLPCPRRHRRMDVVAGLEGGDQPGVLGQVCDAPQLDLVVVGHQECESRRRHERPSERPPGLGPYRDVVEVGGVGTEAPGTGDGLVERGPDPIPLPHLGEETLAVGRPQLLDLPVRQEPFDDRMVVPETLEGGGIGGLRHPDRGSQVGGLHEHRRAQVGEQRVEEDGEGVGTGSAEVVCVEPPVAGQGQVVLGQYLLGGQLVHRQRRAQHPRAHIGHVGHLEQALDGAVLSQRAVQQREHDHGSGGGQFGEAGERVPGGPGRVERLGQFAGGVGGGSGLGQRPASVEADAHRDDVVAVGVDGGQHVAGRHARDVVLGAAAPEEEDERAPG